MVRIRVRSSLPRRAPWRGPTWSGLLILGSLAPVFGATTVPELARTVASTANWEFAPAGSFFYAGDSVTTVGDLDGDGYSDVAVGVPGFDDPLDGFSALGAVYVFRGSANGLSSTPSQTLFGPVASQFGAAVSAAGDVNDDGFDDLLVGEPSGTFDGRVKVFLGSRNGLVVPAAWSYAYVDAGLVGAGLGTSVGAAGDVNGDGYDDIVVGAPNAGDFAGTALLFLGSEDGPLPAPSWSASGGTNWRVGTSVSGAGDVNADGFDDVIVGVPGYSAFTPQGEAVYGGAFVYHGGWPGGSQGPPGLTPFPSIRLSSSQLGDSFGASVSRAGDVNGDGYGDVVVGSPDFDAFSLNSLGRAQVYLGGSGGVTTTVHWEEYGIAANARFGAVVATAGDVDGDGLADVAASAPNYSGGQSTEGYIVVAQGSRYAMFIRRYIESNVALSRFGSSVGTGGDVDGDGFSDLLVGSGGYTGGFTASGRAQLFGGAAEGPSDASGWQQAGLQAGSFWGWVTTSAGDFNGDGFDDLLLTAPNYDVAQVNDGLVAIYLGGSAGPANLWYAVGEASGQSFAGSAACAGDINGDGFDDVVVGASTAAGGLGRVYVWQGSAMGPAPGFDLGNADWVVDGPATGSGFGHSVASAGDVNGDGYADVIIGAPNATDVFANEGIAYVYLGSENGLASTAAWTTRGDQNGAQLGRSVASAGDVNGDGFSDVVVGAEYWDRPLGGQFSLADVGRALVFHGSDQGLLPTPTAILQGVSNDSFGRVVASAGDIDGDGFSDLLVVAATAGTNSAGVVSVFRGSGSGVVGIAHWSFAAEQAFCGFGSGAASAGDVNRDGYSDVIFGANFYDSQSRQDNGRAWIFAGPLTGASATTPLWVRNGDASFENFAQSVGGIGDFNGDGFPDVGAGSTGFTGTLVTEGRVQVFYGNGGEVPTTPDDSQLRRVQQRKSPSGEPIALLGLVPESTDVSLRISAASPAGRTQVRLQWEVDVLGSLLNGNAVASTVWVDNLPAGAGSPVVLDSPPLSLPEHSAMHWRARVASRSPYFPRTPWFSMARNGVQETDLRTAITIDAVEGPVLPRGATLQVTAVPNPFNPRTTLEFELPQRDRTRLTIYDLRGREVARPLDRDTDAGVQRITWDGTDVDGNEVGSGTYFARITSGSHTGLTKLVLVR